ncbi:hypothetical protein F4819DRAFT_193631 [Hypoxylon fuscum]|nr:hypothetical protein F4819DRAFT_193631 [Hypoxylon fuscum]
MMYTKAIILAALAASASAQVPALFPRKTTGDDVIAPEETSSSSPECLSRIQSWSGAIPTPAPDLQSALESNAKGGMAESGVSGLCEFGSDLPQNQASAFTSYNLAMYSYLSAQSSNLVALATTCSNDMGAPPKVITSQLGELLTVYSSFSAGACGKAVVASATATDTAGASTATSASPGNTNKVGIAATTTSSGAESSTTTATDGSAAETIASSAISSALSSATPTQNAGARETGMLAAAALAMGFVGAAVVL